MGRLDPLPIALDPNYDVSRVKSQSLAAFVNVYAVASPGKGKFTPIGIWGREQWGSTLKAPIRGMITVPANRDLNRNEEALYVVGGDTFYRITVDPAGNPVPVALGSVTAGIGLVEMENNRFQVAAITNPEMFVYSNQSGYFGQVTDPDFPGGASLAVADGFGLITAPSGDQFAITGINDFTSFLATDRATAESKADPLTAVRSVNNEPWFLGLQGSEPWINTGAADFPFQRRDVNPNVGCIAQFACINIGDTLVMLGEDSETKARHVYRATGYGWQKASNDAIDVQIADCAHPERAWAFPYAQDGHSFYVMTLPAVGTFALDMETGLWHQWATSVPEPGNVVQPARFTCSASIGGFQILGDTLGRLCIARKTLNTDMGSEMLRQVTAPPFGASGVHSSLIGVDAEMDTGLGTLTSEGEMLLGVSQDGGNTFEGWEPETLGLQGQYALRLNWGPQGAGPSHMLIFRITDDVPWRMTGAYARIKAFG